MTRTNLRKTLAGFLKNEQFRPFYVELVSGHRALVKHPEALELQEELVVFRSPAGGVSVFECEGVGRFVHVDAIEP